MAIQSTLALSPVSPAVYSAVQRAHRPPRRLWLSALRLLLQYLITVPTVAIAAPFVVLRNVFAWMRKHPAWTFKTAVSTTLVRIAIICMGLIRFAPAPHADSTASGLLVYAIQILGWRSYGRQIWADTKTMPHLRHLHGRRLDMVYVSPPPVDWLRGLLAVRNPDEPLDEQISFSPLYYGRPMVEPGFAKRRIKCFWYLPRGKAVPPLPDDNESKQRTKPVLLYCHGGAGVSFSAGDTFMGATLAAVLARNADIDVFTVDYDLAPYAKYPTTLVQLFGAWLYLVFDLGYHPSQIFFGGDSYGAMSVLLLNRYLRDVWPHLEPPSSESLLSVDPSLSDTNVFAKVEQFTRILDGSPVRPAPATPGIVLLSPWLHVDDLGVLFPSRRKAAGHDIVTQQYMTWGVSCLEMTHEHIATNAIPATSPWSSPHYLPAEELAALPPIWLGNGGAEALLDEGTDLVRRARAAGTDAEHYVAPGMPHDFYSIPFEINNAKKHYQLLLPWFVSHYQRAQAQHQTAEAGDAQDIPITKEDSGQVTPRAALPVQAHESSGDSYDTLTESRNTLADSGVMVAPKLSSPASPINLPPKEKDEVHEVHPPAPASIATTDDAAFESAVEPETPRASSPEPSAHWHPARESEAVAVRPAEATPIKSESPPEQPKPLTGLSEHMQPPEAEHLPAFKAKVQLPSSAKLEIQPQAKAKVERKEETKIPSQEKFDVEEPRRPSSTTEALLPPPPPVKEAAKRTSKSKGKSNKRKSKR